MNSYYELFLNRPKEKMNMIENYLYIYHIGYNEDTDELGQFVVLPTYPESIQDSLQSTFSSTSPLARSAPSLSYSNSGPRTMQINLSFHRDMMTEINYGVSNLNVELGDDYVDTIVKLLQACALPNYKTTSKMINPPMVALRFGNEIFIKGIINGSITVTYSGPILDDDRYGKVDIGFTVTETDPYDAETVATLGSFRGMSATFEKRLSKA